MAKVKMTFKQWHASLGGDAVQLGLLPGVLGVSEKAVAKLVVSGQLRMHTFKANDGRVFRLVKRADVQRVKAQLDAARDRVKAKPSMANLARAFEKMMQS